MEEKAKKRNPLTQTKLMGMPLWMFLIVLAVTWIISAAGLLPYNLAGMLAFIMVIGTFLGWLGDLIPIWNKWFGGGIMLAWLAMCAIYTFGLLPESTINCIAEIGIDSGFRDFYIVVLVVGSLCSIDRKMLLKAVGGFIPTCIGGLAVALLFAMGAGLLVGVNPIDAMLNYALPVMGGGTGAGAVPMSEMWAEATGRDASSWFAPAFAALCVADSVAVIMAACLDRLSAKFPMLSCGSKSSNMMRPGKKDRMIADAPKPQQEKATVAEYAYGIGFATFMYLIAYAYSKISFINNANLGFSIHAFAFLVIITAVLITLNVIPERVKVGAQALQKFFAGNIACPLMVIIGCTSSLYDFGVMLLPKNLFIIVFLMIGAVVGSGAVGYLFGFYPIDAAMTAGLCQANAGNSGDLMTLGAGNRLDLLAFSSVATRIGGAITLVVASILFGLFA